MDDGDAHTLLDAIDPALQPHALFRLHVAPCDDDLLPIGTRIEGYVLKRWDDMKRVVEGLLDGP